MMERLQRDCVYYPEPEKEHPTPLLSLEHTNKEELIFDMWSMITVCPYILQDQQIYYQDKLASG